MSGSVTTAAAAGLLGATAACLAKAAQGCMSLEGSVWAKPLCMLLGYGLMLCVSGPVLCVWVGVTTARALMH